MRLSEKAEYALDASALLALIMNEPGQECVALLLDRSFIHAVNLAEVARILVRGGSTAEEVKSAVGELGPTVEETFGEAQALECGRFIANAQRQGLSLGDAVCLVSAASCGATAVTADGAWKQFEGQSLCGRVLKIQLIR
jgi:ribonuclease VapC